MTSSSNERLVGDIFPDTQAQEARAAAAGHVRTALAPRGRALRELDERAYFGELHGERSQRSMGYGHDWLVPQGHEHAAEVIADAALLAANCSVPLMLSVDDPDQAPMFGPDFVKFNGHGDAGDDFTYPPDPGARKKFAFLGSRGECRTELRDYDVLVCAVLLSIRHHMADRGRVRSNGTPDNIGWPPAFELYARTFPDREIPWLDNWPKRTQKAE